VRERARPPEITRDRSRSLEGSARESALEIAITHEGCAREHITSPSRRSNVPSGCMVRGRVWHEEAVTRCQVLAAGRWDGVGGAMPMPKGAMGGMPCMQRTPAMPGMPCVPVAIRMEGWQVRLQAASVVWTPTRSSYIVCKGWTERAGVVRSSWLPFVRLHRVSVIVCLTCFTGA